MHLGIGGGICGLWSSKAATDSPRRRKRTSPATFHTLQWLETHTGTGDRCRSNSLPLKIEPISQNGKSLVAVCSGRWDGIAIIDLKTETTTQWVPLYRTFNGAAFSKNTTAKHFTSPAESIRSTSSTLPTAKSTSTQTTISASSPRGAKRERFLSGIIVHPKTGKLYICNEGTSEIFIVDPDSGKVEAKWQTLAHPYTCALGKDGRYLFVSNWGDRSVSAIDMSTGQQTLRISVGMRPNEMALAPDGYNFLSR